MLLLWGKNDDGGICHDAKHLVCVFASSALLRHYLELGTIFVEM